MTIRTSSSGLFSEAMPDKPEKPPEDKDRVAIPLDPETALRALRKVDPESEPVRDEKAGADAGPKRRC
jgi:hypothetical protein